ncbi:hypothetical protein NY057_00745 [Curtobacterium flaccumfaciens]|uniref:hypothetical protein n=1 Tax=Curtobacterium flaccumfaciens TaxID=2035 RepID=UPI002201A69A|nr:hypothetical protein [Curtobacterium flaccumfaciens]UWD82792.1 hypothetical protein NY057_00745 [Curtobacterium flaccumfaciens]
MPTLTPTEAIVAIERSLRQLLDVALSDQFGGTWMQQLVAADKVSAWEAKRDTEHARRGKRGVGATSQRLLDYAEFHELIALAEKQWAVIAPALGERRDTAALLRRFDQLRNTVAHSRALLPFEEDLLSGIAGEIRNRVTLWMSKATPNGEHWARIEQVTDSLGRAIDGTMMLTHSPAVFHESVFPTLSVGDRVEFDCEASDPFGRDLHWQLHVLPGQQVDSSEGEHVRLRWDVLPEHASSETSVRVELRSSSQSHRFVLGVDGSAAYRYTVLPQPEDSIGK